MGVLTFGAPTHVQGSHSGTAGLEWIRVEGLCFFQGGRGSALEMGQGLPQNAPALLHKFIWLWLWRGQLGSQCIVQVKHHTAQAPLTAPNRRALSLLQLNSFHSIQLEG